MDNNVTHVECWEDLAKTIVTQGVDDYKRALNMKRALERKLHSVDKAIVECEKFFKSQWCKELSELEGDFIMENARETAEQEYNNDYESVTVTIRMKRKKKDDK